MLNMPSAMSAFAMIDQAFGTTLVDAAEKYGIGSIDPNKKITREEVMSLAVKYPDVTSMDFSMVDYVSDMEKLGGTFGFKKGTIKLIGANDNETFVLGLNLIDMILTGLALLPVDKSDKIKDGVYLVATTIKKFIPSMQDIGKLLAKAPALAKYSKAFDEFGKALDKALEILNEGKNPSEAIEVVKDAIHAIRKLDVQDIMKEAKENKIKQEPPMIEGEATKVEDDSASNKKDNKQKNPTKEKKEKTDMKTDPTVAAVAAMQQGEIPPFMNMEYQAPVLDNPAGSIPEILNPNLVREDPNKCLPEIVTENRQQVPQFNPMDHIFSPIDPQNIQQQVDSSQKTWVDYFDFVKDIVSIANNNGYWCTAEPMGFDGKIKSIFFRVYNNNGYLYKKSFMVDCGSIIDGRYGIWPVGVVDESKFTPMEMCDIAYHLRNREGGINGQLIENIIKFGFDGVDPQVLNGHILYRDRIIKANRRVDLISAMNAYNKDNKERDIVRGAVIRAVVDKNIFDPKYGRFAFESFDAKTLNFTLTNINVPLFMYGPINVGVPQRVLFTPSLNEKGERILINPDKGGDIQFDVRFLLQE